MSKILFYTFGKNAERLVSNGWIPIPIIKGQKRPAIKDWPRVDPLDQEVLESLLKSHAEAGVGLVCGDVLAVDVDIVDPEASFAIRTLVTGLLGETPLIRYGDKPKFAALYKVEGAKFRKITTPPLLLRGDKAQIEVQASGCQIVIFNIHPKTQRPYEWENETPLDIAIEDLPGVTLDQMTSFLDKCEALLTTEFGGTSKQHELRTSHLAAEPSEPRALPHQAQLKEALKFLDPQDRDTWISVGHSLKSIKSEAALELFLDWSKRRPDGSQPSNYVSANDVRKTWDTLKPNRTNVSALFRKAMRAGWSSKPYEIASVTHTSIAKHLLEISRFEGPGHKFDEGELWHFLRGCWVKMTVGDQRGLVHQLDGLLAGNKTIRASSGFVSGVLSEHVAMAEDLGFFADAPVGANVTNGFIKIDDDGKVLFGRHDPNHRQRSVLNIPWDANVPEKPSGLLKIFLDGTFGDPSKGLQKLALQILGVAIVGSSTRLTQPKAFVLFGPSASNGKSQFLELIRSLVPNEAIGNISPGDFGKEQFVAELVGKTANLCDELDSARSLSSDRFKALITGDPIAAKIVHKRVFSFVPKALHVFASNQLPNFTGGIDAGVQRRLVCIKFEKSIPEGERVAEIAKKIVQTQGQEVLALAVKAASEVFKNGQFSIPPSVERDTQNWFAEADIVRGWVEDGSLGKHIFVDGTLLTDLFAKFNNETDNLSDPRHSIGSRLFAARLRQCLAGHEDFYVKRDSQGHKVCLRKLF